MDKGLSRFVNDGYRYSGISNDNINSDLVLMERNPSDLVKNKPGLLLSNSLESIKTETTPPYFVEPRARALAKLVRTRQPHWNRPLIRYLADVETFPKTYPIPQYKGSMAIALPGKRSNKFWALTSTTETDPPTSDAGETFGSSNIDYSGENSLDGPDILFYNLVPGDVFPSPVSYSGRSQNSISRSK